MNSPSVDQGPQPALFLEYYHFKLASVKKCSICSECPKLPRLFFLDLLNKFTRLNFTLKIDISSPRRVEQQPRHNNLTWSTDHRAWCSLLLGYCRRVAPSDLRHTNGAKTERSTRHLTLDKITLLARFYVVSSRNVTRWLGLNCRKILCRKT